jgi:hypothetical protein
MFFTHCMLYAHFINIQDGDWIECAPPLCTEHEPSIDDVYRHIPKWVPFLEYMNVSLVKNSETDTSYTFKIKYQGDSRFEITCHTTKRVIVLPKWRTLTYGDLISVLYSIFKKPIRIRPIVSDASYVRECTRSMHQEHDAILLY